MRWIRELNQIDKGTNLDSIAFELNQLAKQPESDSFISQRFIHVIDQDCLPKIRDYADIKAV